MTLTFTYISSIASGRMDLLGIILKPVTFNFLFTPLLTFLLLMRKFILAAEIYNYKINKKESILISLKWILLIGLKLHFYTLTNTP